MTAPHSDAPTSEAGNAEITLEDMRAEVAREIAMRRRVYTRQVGLGRMEQATADRAIAIMEAVLADLEARAEVGQ